MNWERHTLRTVSSLVANIILPFVWKEWVLSLVTQLYNSPSTFPSKKPFVGPTINLSAVWWIEESNVRPDLAVSNGDKYIIYPT